MDLNQTLYESYDQYVQAVYALAKQYAIESAGNGKTENETLEIINGMLESSNIDLELHRGIEETIREYYDFISPKKVKKTFLEEQKVAEYIRQHIIDMKNKKISKNKAKQVIYKKLKFSRLSDCLVKKIVESEFENGY